ncbi:uncharacterized protein N7458_003884 [Penicillium daleae]|uniref:2EXR domain-containing protein n=1 Tax=Penicillium daleae TaxID=63821 RepID=A0AAD6G4V2_9EURO|nr:uncharacterized protein N7458_003884 [Penicillium daleae]KAJ5455620.1 hypothetical protein N7458_003884 [Penicillium daleae]
MRVKAMDDSECEYESEPEPAMISSRTIVKASGPEFHLFNQLPTELRRMIWKLCLPSRVVELNHARWVAFDTLCDGEWTSIQNTLPPPISQVNREARAVAMEVAVFKWTIDSRHKTSKSWGLWFQRKKDTIVMYRKDVAPFGYYYQDYPFDEVVRKWFAKKALGTAVFSEMINPWNRYSGTQGLEAGMQHAPKTGWNDPMIILESIPIHARREEVLAAGVFGKLADEPIQLVDPLDAEHIRQYYQLYQDLPKTRPQSPSAQRFFEVYAKHPGRVEVFQGLVRDWIEQGKAREFQHLWEKWKAARDDNFSGIDHPEMIWIGPAAANMLDERILILGSVDGGINLKLFRPNETHSWVQANLVKSSFTPRIMFRWCADSCWSAPGR